MANLSIVNRFSHIGLQAYVLFLGELPLLPQIILSTDAEKRVWASSRWMYQGASLWLRNILLGQPLSPKAYEGKLLYSEPFAELLAATFRLTTAVYPRTFLKELLEFPSPAALWFHCCWVRSEKSLESSGLTGYPALIGKREYSQKVAMTCSKLKLLSFEPDRVPTPTEAPELLLLTEAQALAKADYNFYLDHLTPYLQVYQRTIKKTKNCKYLQYYYLLPDGSLFITGKDLKLPAKHREVPKIV